MNRGFLYREDVTPIPKQGPREPKPPRALPRVGKKGRRDRRELAKTKPILLARSGGRCEAKFAPNCRGVGAHQHHIRPRSAGGSNDPENLLWTCHRCHNGGSGIHDLPITARSLGLLAPRVAA